MRLTPDKARFYLLLAAFLLVLPTLATLYKGQTGKLLVAVSYSKTAGTPFHKSVIYIVKHDLFHAYGYIINSPFSDSQVKAISDDGGVPLYYGGPVGDKMPSYMDWSKEGELVFSSAVTEDHESEYLRKLYGYAGWAPLQLNYELSRGLWAVIDFDPALVFETDPEQIWPKAQERLWKRPQDRIL